MSTFNPPTFQSSYNEPNKREMSTAEKYYDVEESQKRYQQLLEENMYLKQQIQRTRIQDPYCPQCHTLNHNHTFSHNHTNTHEHLPHSSDMTLWSMLERNRYLEQKIEKLRVQHQKQSKTIHSIRSSDKWRNRFTCTPQTNSCYEDKYLQLLRIRSPFY